jgi:hypothetical protein
MNLTNRSTLLAFGTFMILASIYIIYQNQSNLRVFRELIQNVKDLNINTKNHLETVKEQIVQNSNQINKQISSVERLCLNSKLGPPDELDNKLKGQYNNYDIPPGLINDDENSKNMDDSIFFDEDSFNREIQQSNLVDGVVADDESENTDNELDNESINVNNSESNIDDEELENDDHEDNQHLDNIQESLNDDIEGIETLDNQDELTLDDIQNETYENHELEVNEHNPNEEDLIDKQLLEKMTLKELRSFASNNKITQKGTKGELLQRVKTELNLI